MHPEARVEQAVVQQLLQQEVAVVGGAGHQVLGQLQEGVEEVRGEMFPAGPGQEVGDDEEAAARNDLLLNAGAALHQLTDELHETGAEAGVLPDHISSSAVCNTQE